MKKISIVTLGCKVNQYESEELAEILEKDGYEVSMGLVFADIFVINTCAVTNEAERKSRNIITKLLKLNPNSKIYICGCASENNKENFKKGDNIKGIIGTNNKALLAKQIENDDEEFINNQKLAKDKRVSGRTRAVLWVQNGCNNFCSYCIIPYLRGRETSFPLKEIEKKLHSLEKVSNEIVVAGINLSAYGGTVTLTDAKLLIKSDTSAVLKGDINSDGEVSTADLIQLAKWLHGFGTLTNWKNADITEDNLINIYDFIALKQNLLKI